MVGWYDCGHCVFTKLVNIVVLTNKFNLQAGVSSQNQHFGRHFAACSHRCPTHATALGMLQFLVLRSAL